MSESVSSVPPAQGRVGLELFLIGFLVLFLELACIRWFAAYVVFLQFFTNVVLIASFLGMSCGCLAARAKRDWLDIFPVLAFWVVAAAFFMFVIYDLWDGLAIAVGHQNSPQEVFFGTEFRDPDVAKFVIPIDLVVAVFFVAIALMFVGLGQVLGRAFAAYPNRVMAYTFNIGGSLAGIALFSAISFAQAPPVVWFAVVCAGVAYLLHVRGRLPRGQMIRLGGIVCLFLATLKPGSDAITRWSPYYSINFTPSSGHIFVNTIGYQDIVPFEESGSSYSLIHLLQRESGGAPFGDALIIGAGSGNDMAHALRYGVQRLDAVEIDPIIQDIGIHYHPDHPYQDKRVTAILDDGRHFLRTTDRKYNLVIYALVDSLILHSSYANLRLESYLFTEEAFADAKRVLKPGGLFVMYNFYRQGWIVERVSAMAEKTFGCPPVVISLPYLAKLAPDQTTGFTMIIAGCTTRIADAFAAHKTFWLNTVPPKNLAAHGFDLDPSHLPADERGTWQPIAPTSLLHDAAAPILASDDWPFLYLRGRLIPNLTVRSMVVLGALGLAMVYLFLPKGRMRIDGRMFFLGAGFMLLETKAVVQMALLFGSTWLVNSLVFFTVLLLILLANLYVLKVHVKDVAWHYAGLLLLLALAVAVPLDAFLSGGLAWRYALPSLLALGPMYFAGVVFARSFAGTADPDYAFGSNIAGAVVGGLSESFSTVLGFRYLLLVAAAFYLLSAWVPSLGVKER